MNKLNSAKRSAVVAALVEGNSIRSTVRLTGVSMPTVLRLLTDMGAVCSRYQDAVLKNLPCKRIECDEIWSFVGAKAGNVPQERRGQYGVGDVWTWVGICADTKLVPSWLVGTRNAVTGYQFMQDLASRLRHRVQLTTDAHKPYLAAVEGAFGEDIDFAVLQKVYGQDPAATAERRYSPAKIKSAYREVLKGSPDPRFISTSYVERQNLTMRMSMRRFTRLTNAFSKKVENHAAAVALHFMNYNFCRIHKTTRVTPAMAAGVTDHVWNLSEVVGLLEIAEEIKAA